MENKNAAAAIISEWNGLTTQEQINFITACTFKIIKAQPAGLRYETNELVNEAWLRIAGNMTADKLSAINERRTSQGKAPTTLVGIVYRAVRASIAAISYSEKKHSAANVRTIKGKDEEESDYTNTVPTSGDDTETTAILRALLERFAISRDKIDQQIIAGTMEGMTEREIAAIVSISAPAVHKRIVKIRAALAEVI